jgi:hypothetical protein
MALPIEITSVPMEALPVDKIPFGKMLALRA